MGEQGQVYIPEVNWMLCIACVIICCAFRSSARLAGAYGVTVTSTFLITTILLWIIVRRVWRWHLLTALLLIVPMLIVDGALWSANLLKIFESGWFPVVIAMTLCLFMHTHLWGRRQEENVMAKEVEEETEEMQARGTIQSLEHLSTLPALQSVLQSERVVRTDKVAIFLTPYTWRVPRTVGTLATSLGCLPRTIVLLSFRFEDVPFVCKERRASFESHGEGVFSVVLHFGYAEPLTPERLAVHKELATLGREHADMHPSLLPLTMLDLRSSNPPLVAKPDEPHIDSQDVREDLEEGQHQMIEQQERQPIGPSFVLHRVHYAMQPDVQHCLWDRLRIALYQFIVLNARKPIRFFGLQGGDTMEISVVRFL